MKTTKFFSVLGLVLILAGVDAVYSANVLANNSKQLINATIRYEVTIHLSLGINTCNTYMVQVTDETGRLVAPVKIFVPGVDKYVFNETFFVPGRARVASLVLPSNIDPYVCPINLLTKPDVKTGPFLYGRTYSFDLFPLIQKGAIKEN